MSDQLSAYVRALPTIAPPITVKTRADDGQGPDNTGGVEAIDRLDPFGSALVGPPENDLPT
ncbi:MAG: hypothetical protein QOF66_1333 [Mycobacterium sp.]|jgi:hypothetical protein|uniref:hypothetical protein n=1 Tax=Mycobacterium sp. TaxID=1785 RepID=UPI0028B3A694|nr:hypothetical protein [Mycobacterium sp.]